jgi:hypothetical protein
MSFARAPGTIIEMPPSLTLDTNLTPSGMITSPSFPTEQLAPSYDAVRLART